VLFAEKPPEAGGVEIGEPWPRALDPRGMGQRHLEEGALDPGLVEERRRASSSERRLGPDGSPGGEVESQKTADPPWRIWAHGRHRKVHALSG
jgi:hypothetical protein